MDADGGLMRFGALNAADPRTPIQRAREASGYDRMASEERLAAHQRIAAELQRPGPGLTDAEMDAAEEEAAAQVFAERYPGVDPVQFAIDNAPVSTVELTPEAVQAIRDGREAATRGEFVVPVAGLDEYAPSNRHAPPLRWAGTARLAPLVGVDAAALVTAYEGARVAYEAGDGLDAPDTRTRRRGGVEAGIRAVLAALGIEVRDDG